MSAIHRIIFQILCYIKWNNLKHVAYQYTMYNSTMCRDKVILSRSEPRERAWPTCCMLCIEVEGFPNVKYDEIWVTPGRTWRASNQGAWKVGSSLILNHLLGLQFSVRLSNFWVWLTQSSPFSCSQGLLEKEAQVSHSPGEAQTPHLALGNLPLSLHNVFHKSWVLCHTKMKRTIKTSVFPSLFPMFVSGQWWALLWSCHWAKGRVTGWASNVLTKSGWEFVPSDGLGFS